jgi:hypothetical protein
MVQSKRIQAAAGLVLAAAMLVGCGSENKLAPSWVNDPQVSVDAVELTGRSDLGAAMQVVVTLTNPNEDALPLVGASYKVAINGAIYQTRTNPNAELPGSGQVTVRLPAAIRGMPEDGYTVNGTIRYKPPGQLREVMTDLGVPLPSVSFTGSGRLTGDPEHRDVPLRGDPIEPQPDAVPLAPAAEAEDQPDDPAPTGDRPDPEAPGGDEAE